jgi:hypothetical protein
MGIAAFQLVEKGRWPFSTKGLHASLLTAVLHAECRCGGTCPPPRRILNFIAAAAAKLCEAFPALWVSSTASNAAILGDCGVSFRPRERSGMRFAREGLLVIFVNY